MISTLSKIRELLDSDRKILNKINGKPVVRVGGDTQKGNGKPAKSEESK